MLVQTSAHSFLLRIAIVTHKGAAADAGHYIAFVKKSVFHTAKGKTSPLTGATGASVEVDDDDEDWYKFDDDKVSLFPKEKLATLDGGGTCLLSMWTMVLKILFDRGGFIRICTSVQDQTASVS